MNAKKFGCFLAMLAIAPMALACGSGPKPVHYGPLVYPAPTPKAPVAEIKGTPPTKPVDRTAAKIELAQAGNHGIH
jgi:hypothetical protein